MKVRVSIKRICAYCKIIRRGKSIYNLCVITKHKQRQK